MGGAGWAKVRGSGPLRTSPVHPPRYAVIPPEARPRAESLRDVTARLLPYWYD